jgi:Oxysterol-binding protein
MASSSEEQPSQEEREKEENPSSGGGEKGKPHKEKKTAKKAKKTGKSSSSAHAKKASSEKEEKEHKEVAAGDGEHHEDKGFLSLVRSFMAKLKPGDDLTHESMHSSFMAPRSLTELIAEVYLPRLYLLTLASQMPTPEERMLGVLRHFLFCFFVNKPGNKPFNPVLGECFDGYVQFEEGGNDGTKTTGDGDGEDNDDGGADNDDNTAAGIPAAALGSTSTSREQHRRTRLARARMEQELTGKHASLDESPAVSGAAHLHVEQISHHPPVTASYFHHDASGVSGSRKAGAKVTFHGTYISVVTTGSASVRFDRPGPNGNDNNNNSSGDASSDADADPVVPENYVISQAPSIHFRIFRMASEYVGKGTIFCPETGVGASYRFKEKPTFGGHWNDVDASVWRVTGATRKEKKNAKAVAQIETVFELSGNWLEGLSCSPAAASKAKSQSSAKDTSKGSKKSSTAKKQKRDKKNENPLLEDRAWSRDSFPALLFEEDPEASPMSTHHVWGEAMEAIV